MQDEQDLPIVLVGAGLASALIAQRLASGASIPPVVMLESGAAFGEHTWSFHLADVDPTDLLWIGPLIAHRWDGQSVRFRNHRRHLASGYASLTSASVQAAIGALENVVIRTGAEVVSLAPDRVTLADGTVIQAACVIDCRGYADNRALVLGYQKFVGLEVELEHPHGLVDPVIMDASIDQHEGYRFIYLLPFSATRLLIEDTRYTDVAELDETNFTGGIMAYAEMQQWSIAEIVRREHGILPIALAYDFERFWSDKPSDIPQAGMRAGLFHPTTGYSLPEAVRLANLIATHWPVNSATLAGKIRRHAAGRHRQQRFYRLLNRMLFLAAQPERRHLVLERFYKMPRLLIERFYAGRTTPGDMVRILVGKPPVPIHRAIACLRETPLLRAEKH